MPENQKGPLTASQWSSLGSQLGWWLGSVRRSIERLQSYDAQVLSKRRDAETRQKQAQEEGRAFGVLDASSVDDLFRLLQSETDFISLGFDEAQILANALTQIDSHLKELEDDPDPARHAASKAFRDAFRASDLRDLRNAIEHMAEHAAGRESVARAHLSPTDTDNVGFKLDLGWPISIAMFGLTYTVSEVINLAIDVDEAWGGSKDRWPTPRSKDFYEAPA